MVFNMFLHPRSRALAAIFLLALTSQTNFGQTRLNVGDAAPDFSGTTIDGRDITLAGLKGRTVVLSFWSTRCAICHSERPALNQMATRLRRQNVELLAVSTEDTEKIGSYLRVNPIEFSVIPDGFAVVLRYADRDRVGNLDMGYPAFFVIDKSGAVRHRSSGWGKAPSVEAAVTRLILDP